MNISARQIAHEEEILLRLALLFLLVGVGVALLSSWFLAAGLTGPLEHLVLQIERIAKGDLTVSIPVDRRDELGELAQEFNQMMVQIKASQDEIKAWSRELEKRVEEKTQANIKLQEQLAQTAKMAAIGQLSAGIAHELRNPMGIISSSAYYLKEHAEGLPDDVHKHLGIIERNIVRSESIIKGLLDFSKSPDTATRKVKVNDLIREALSMLEEEAASRKVRVTRRLSEIPEIYGSSEGLRQAFFNIMLNAVQAMSPGGRLVVRSAVSSGDVVIVEIQDTGHGIPEEHLEAIFNPFFTTKEPGEGVGLGLSLAYSIVERHSGRITVQSRIGKGSTFRVELPRDRRLADREASSE
jgi:signal transduction histidine kinase